MLIFPNNRRGFSIISAMIASAIIALLVFEFVNIFLDGKFSAKRNQNSELANSNAASIAVNLRSADFFDLVTFCKNKNAINTTKSTSCISGNAFNLVPSADTTDIRYNLEQPLNIRGRPPATGEEIGQCIELYRCNVLAGGKILEINLNQFYKSPNGSIFNQMRSFRKSRW